MRADNDNDGRHSVNGLITENVETLVARVQTDDGSLVGLTLPRCGSVTLTPFDAELLAVVLIQCATLIRVDRGEGVPWIK